MIPDLIDMPEDAPEWARVLNSNLRLIRDGVNSVLETNSNAASSIESIKEQVGPVIDNLAKSPMLRMLGVGK